MNGFDVTVVGGGLGGLATATLLARRGLAVTLLERASTLGGRAATAESSSPPGFSFNQGAHALYRSGPADRVLRDLGVRWTGGRPTGRGLAVLRDRRFALPASTGSLFTTGLLGWSAKCEQPRVLRRLHRADERALATVPIGDWLRETIADPVLRATIETVVRLTTFANAPGLLSAGAAIAQLRRAMRAGVSYVDGGWQTLVGGATLAAQAAGVQIRTGAHAADAERDGGYWVTRLTDGARIGSRGLALAVGPGTARSLVRSEALDAWAGRATPQRAACLDVGLARLPDPRTTFALGVDRPLYFSVHSVLARVAPAGAALVSAMKYLSPTEAPDSARDEAELEAWLELLQPGWRDVLRVRRSLPAMITSHAIVTATDGGLAGRSGPRVPDAEGLVVVGDWVGPEGQLLDAVLASAEHAARDLAFTLERERDGVRDRASAATAKVA